MRASLIALVAVLGLLGLSVEPAAEAAMADTTLRDAVVDEAIPLQAELRASNASTFGGLWVGQDGTPHINVVGADARTVEKIRAVSWSAPPDIRTVEYSEADLIATKRAISSAAAEADFTLEGARVARIGVDVVNNRVDVVALDATPSELSAIAGRFGPSIVASTTDRLADGHACTRSSCPNPFKAGLNIYQNGVFWCTGGYLLKRSSAYYWSSAGRCGNIGDVFQHPSGSNAGTVTFRSWYDQAPTDALLFGVSSSAKASNILYVGNGATRSITSREQFVSQVIGEGVCTSRHGSESTNCGSLTNIDQDIYVCPSGQACRFILNMSRSAGTPNGPGDSGSPMYYGTKALGMASEGGSNYAWYNQIQAIENTFGATVLTSIP
jgi:hypothetical protein